MTINQLTTSTPTNTGPLRTGARTSRLVLGKLPRKLQRLERGINQYREALETAVVERWGEISIADAHSINLAATAELQAAIAYWALRQRADSMSTADTLACGEAITKARTKRNQAVAALKLDRPTQAEIDAQTAYDLYGHVNAGMRLRQPQPLSPATSHAGPAQSAYAPANATAGHQCDQGRDASSCETSECLSAAQAGQEQGEIQDSRIPIVEGNQDGGNQT